MPSRLIKLTPQLTKEIYDRICGGGFAEIAAESVGVPVALLHRWLAAGAAKNPKKLYRDFYQSVMRGKAHARLMAETAMRTADPGRWLLHGPGKLDAYWPTWTAQAKPLPLEPAGPRPRDIFPMIEAVLCALENFPEARTAVNTALAQVEQRIANRTDKTD